LTETGVKDGDISTLALSVASGDESLQSSTDVSYSLEVKDGQAKAEVNPNPEP